MQYVIIGNSAAGLAGAETIRKLEPSGSITIISDEPHAPYSRPLLTFLLGGEINREGLWLKDSTYYQSWNFTPLLGRKVIRVAAKDRTVRLSSGQEVNYDRLLIASGARPLLPGIPGQDLEGVFTIRTLHALEKLKKYLTPDSRVAVIGSGLVGIKTAQALAHRKSKVVLLARKKQVLSNLLDTAAAEILHRAMRASGIELRFEAVPVALQGEKGRVQGVRLADGAEVPADLVIFGIGVTPNVEFLAEAGLAEVSGIPVDQQLRTAREDIFAAGDCVQPLDRLSGQRSYFAIWPAAVEQGRLAGANMAGQHRTYGGLLAQNTLFVGNTRIIAGGVVRPPDSSYEVHCQQEPRQGHYRRLVVHDGRLVGIILVGQVEDAGVYFQLIYNGTPLQSLPIDPRHSNFQVGRLLG
jgi:NAD(P)H-nitrite reductase large subunit